MINHVVYNSLSHDEFHYNECLILTELLTIQLYSVSLIFFLVFLFLLCTFLLLLFVHQLHAVFCMCPLVNPISCVTRILLCFTANETSYVAVFVVAALCAVVLFGIVFGRCWYLRRRTKSQNFAVLHKPKRFFDPALDHRQSNGHAGRRASRDQANEELLTEKTMPRTEVVITRADVESTQPSRRPSRNDGESSMTSRNKPT